MMALYDRPIGDKVIRRVADPWCHCVHIPEWDISIGEIERNGEQEKIES